jgi:hypothetical protein
LEIDMAKRKAAKRKASGSGVKRVGRPVTTGIGQLIGLRCREEFIAAVDQWRQDQAKASGGNVTALTRPAAIVKLAEIGLANKK